MWELLNQHARFEPILRLARLDSARRIFGMERRSASGKDATWIRLSAKGKLGQLLQQLLPKLGRDDLLESL